MAEGDTNTAQQGPQAGPQSPAVQAVPTPVSPVQVQQQAGPVLQQPQQPVPAVTEAQSPPPMVSVDQAKMAADQIAGGLQQGLAQLQQTGVGSVFKKAENQPKVTKEERLWAGVSYIPLVALVALISMPNSAFVRLHAKQGLLIFIFFFICLFVLFVPFIGPLFGGLIQLALFILGLFSMYQSFIGNWWKIPVLGEVAEMIPVGVFTKVSTEIITGQPAPQEPAVSPEASVQPQQNEPPVVQTPPPDLTPPTNK